MRVPAGKVYVRTLTISWSCRVGCAGLSPCARLCRIPPAAVCEVMARPPLSGLLPVQAVNNARASARTTRSVLPWKRAVLPDATAATMGAPQPYDAVSWSFRLMFALLFIFDFFFRRPRFAASASIIGQEERARGQRQTETIRRKKLTSYVPVSRPVHGEEFLVFSC